MMETKSHFYLNVDALDALNGSKSTPIPAAQMVSEFATMGEYSGSRNLPRNRADLATVPNGEMWQS